MQRLRQEVGREGAERSAFFALGANLGEAERTVAAAVLGLAIGLGRPVRASRLWRTPAFPPGSGPDYVNAAVRAETRRAPDDLLALCHRIEQSHGRTRDLRWEARVLDVDLIALGQEILPDMETHERWRRLPLEEQRHTAPSTLVLPHPRMSERGFVLAPLAEVAGDWRHPTLCRTVPDMLAELPQEAMTGVEVISP